MKNLQPHIGCRPKDIGKIVLLPGDPARARQVAYDFLKKARLISEYREFVAYTGFYKNIKISVISTGIGSPSTAMVVEEAINIGAKILIRVGTCGGALKKEIAVGSIIIPTSAIREEGTTKEYVDTSFPAVADYRVITELEKAAKQQNFKYYVGVNRTHDAFYGQSENLKKWGSLYTDPRMKKWPYPLLSSEMECAPVFLISTLRGVLSGAVLAVNYTPEPLNEIMRDKFKFSSPGTHLKSKPALQAVERAIVTALEASVELNKLLKENKLVVS